LRLVPAISPGMSHADQRRTDYQQNCEDSPKPTHHGTVTVDDRRPEGFL
jgi:hypothetical protein